MDLLDTEALNTFTIYCNQKSGKNVHLFTGVNDEKNQFLNPMLVLLKKYTLEYAENEQMHPKRNLIFTDPKHKIEGVEYHTLSVKKDKFYSRSFWALILKVTEENIIDWKID